MPLPYLTDHIAPVDATFRAHLEDFVVDELPAYAPTGEGTHLFVQIEKRGVTTPQAVKALCRTVGADPSKAGWAGLKDRRGVTRQWVSLQDVEPGAVAGVDVDDVRVLQASPHPHKLRTGHLHGNRFRVRLRDVAVGGIDRMREVLLEVESRGLPNYYGEQRFGRAGDNVARAREWLTGRTRPPKDRFRRKLDMSSLQSEIFNECVAERVRTSTLGKVRPGDLMKKHDTGGLFVAEDVTEAQDRADAWEISPTGPIFGAKMQWPTGEAREREEALLDASGLTPADWGRWKRIAPGTRRFVRIPVTDVGLEAQDGSAVLDFTLPSGSYATILVREILKRDAPAPKSG